MRSEEYTHEYIVVHDGLPSTDTNGVESHSTPTSPINRASPDGDQDSAHRRRSGRPGDSLDRLRAMPILREIPWYKGKELPPDKSIESSRVQTRGACLLVSRGKVKNPPCSHCATGVGRFSQCIAHEDWFHGACATCQLATRGNLCTYRRKETLRIKPEDKPNERESDTLNTVPSKNTPQTREQRIEPKPRSQEKAASRTPTSEGTGPSKKRKRETLQATAVWKQYVSPYLPAMPSGSIQTSLNGTTPILYPTPQSSYLQSPYQSTPPPHSDTPPVNYIYQKENAQIIPKPQVVSKPLGPKITPVQVNNHSGRHPESAADRRDSKGSRGREATDSLSPSVQLLQPFQSSSEEPKAPAPQVQGFVPINVHPKSSEPPDRPLIDTLSRKKQKQIYGVIGGLQSGIRSCKQQAENMQKQLDLLQIALGIDVEDENDVPIVA